MLPAILPGGRVPGWVDRAQRAAGFIDSTSKNVIQNTNQVAELVRTLSSDLEEKARTLSASEAADLAQKQAEKLAGQASENLSVLHTSVRKSLADLGEDAQRRLEENPELDRKAQLVRRKTQELGDRIAESEFGGKAQALGASLWQWGLGATQDLQASSVFGQVSEAKANIQASVTSFVDPAGEQNSPPSTRATKISSKGLLDEDDDDLLGDNDRPLGEDRNNVGLIRGAEDKGLRRGLLDEDDDDDDDEERGVDLLGMAAAIQEPKRRGDIAAEAPFDPDLLSAPT